MKFGYDILQKIQELKVREFVRKPFDIEILLEKIKLIKQELQYEEKKENLELIDIQYKKRNFLYRLFKRIFK